MIHETGLSGNVVASFFPPIIFILLCFNVLSTVPLENRLADFLYILLDRWGSGRMTWALESRLIDKLSISCFSSIGYSGEGCYVKSTDAHQTGITIWCQISFTAQKPSFTVNFSEIVKDWKIQHYTNVFWYLKTDGKFPVQPCENWPLLNFHLYRRTIQSQKQKRLRISTSLNVIKWLIKLAIYR